MDYVQYTSETAVCAEKMLNALSAFLGSVRFDQWFGPQTQLRLTDTALVLGVKNQFCLDWIRSNLLRKIEEFAPTLFGKPYRILLEVAPPTATQNKQPAAKTVVPSIPKQPEFALNGVVAAPHFAAQRTFGFSSDFLPQRPAEPRPSSPVMQPNSKKAAAKPKGGRTFATLETFVEGLSNRLACRAADLAVNHSGEINPIYLYGAASVGKTHLLEGIWSAIRRRNEDKQPLYMTCEQFVAAYLDALPKANFSRDKVNAFRERFRNISVFLLDDIHQLAGKGATQSEFLILLDQLRQRGVQMVFTGNRAPNELQGLRSEIVSRLESGMSCEIQLPERETAYKIFRSMAQRRNVPLSGGVCRLVASRLGTNARQLLGALNRLHAVYLSSGQMLTAEQAEEVLGDLLRSCRRSVRLPDIEKAVCETFDIEEESLHSKSRAKHIAAPRMAAMWLARKYTRSSLTEIGQYFGGRSHSTVVTAQRKVDKWVDATDSAAGLDVPIAEAIRKIEDLLR